MGVTGLAGFALADSIPGDNWPKYYAKDFAQTHWDNNTSHHTSGSSRFDYLTANYDGTSWKYTYRYQNATGAVFRDDDGSTNESYLLDGYQRFHVEERLNEGDLDTYHGDEEWNFAASPSPSSSDLPDVPNWVVEGIKAAAGYWNPYVGAAITAHEIYSAFTQNPGNDPATGIYHDRDISAVGKTGWNMEFIADYLPKDVTGNDDHSFIIFDEVTNIPDDELTSNSTYHAEWEVHMGSMYAPSSMSTSQKKKYGVEKVDAKTARTLGIETVESGSPTYIARNPPVSATLQSTDGKKA